MQKPQSLTTWAAVRDLFYKKYFSESKSKYLTRQVQSYKQKEGESFLRCWERFKDLLLSLPYHGFVKHQLVSFFYLGLNIVTTQQIEFICKEKYFLDKSSDDVWDFLDELAEKYQSWEPSDLGDRAMAALGPSGSGIFPLSVREHNVQSQLDKMAKQLEDLKLKQVHQVNEVRVEEVCVMPNDPVPLPTSTAVGVRSFIFWTTPGINYPQRNKQTDEMMKALMQSQISFTE
ncbi:hypothetical protein C3L33_00630, partial [Rhododendron williamsianum]